MGGVGFVPSSGLGFFGVPSLVSMGKLVRGACGKVSANFDLLLGVTHFSMGSSPIFSLFFLSPAGGVPSPSLRFSGSGAWLSQQDVFFLGLVLFLEGLSTDPPCILLVLLLLVLYYMSVRVFGIKNRLL